MRSAERLTQRFLRRDMAEESGSTAPASDAAGVTLRKLRRCG